MDEKADVGHWDGKRGRFLIAVCVEVVDVNAGTEAEVEWFAPGFLGSSGVSAKYVNETVAHCGCGKGPCWLRQTRQLLPAISSGVV